LSNSIVNSGIDADAKLFGWNSEKPIAWSPSEGASQTGSVKMTLESDLKSAGNMGYFQCIIFIDPIKFSYGVSVKLGERSAQQSGRGVVRLLWYESGNCAGPIVYQENIVSTGNRSWQKKQVSGSSPVKARSVSY
jgi:hypothetical protein